MTSTEDTDCSFKLQVELQCLEKLPKTTDASRFSLTQEKESMELLVSLKSSQTIRRTTL